MVCWAILGGIADQREQDKVGIGSNARVADCCRLFLSMNGSSAMDDGVVVCDEIRSGEVAEREESMNG